MKTIVALPLLVLALAGCDPYYGTGQPAPYPQSPQGYPQGGYPPYPGTGYPSYPAPPMPPGPAYPGPTYPGPTYPAPAYPGPGQSQPGLATYRAIGTEPFWDLEIGRDLIFTDRGNDLSVSQPAPPPIQGVAGPVYRTPRIEVNITHRQCSDGMSDRTYPDTVQVYVDGRLFGGCGAPIGFFDQVSESGQPQSPLPPPGPVASLTGTNWRVIAINGIRTPTSNFYMNFMPDRIGARFGCNTLGVGYRQAGNRVTLGAVAATRMACPDMSFESQGMRILEQPVTVSGLGERITLSNERGSIELVQAR